MKRMFKIGSIVVDDPAPNGTLKEVFELLVQRFPPVRHSALLESDAELKADDNGGHLLYEIPLAKAVKTNG